MPFHRPYSHIYVEDAIACHPATEKILSRFPKATIVSITRYSELFNRPRQNWREQKSSPSLILAKRHDSFLYPGAAITAHADEPNFYYNTPAMNCLYDCHYCYLQGLYPSAHMVIFVNQEDYFAATRKELERLGSLSLSISYDTDLLAMESIAPWCTRWIEFAAGLPSLKVEVRTKSANFKAIENVASVSNVILAWTVSPEAVIQQYEKGTPSLRARLNSALRATEHGWKVRLCFDPVLYVENWRELYHECIRDTFEAIEPARIHDVTIGTFRMNPSALKRIQKARPDSALLHHPVETSGQIAGYGKPVASEMVSHLKESLKSALVASEKTHCFL